MNKLFLTGILFLSLISSAFAEITRTMQHNLTISGTPINGTTIVSNSTITSDSVYQAGAQTFGYSALASQISGTNPSIKITYQTSYDNQNWFIPNTTSAGTLTAQNVLANSANGNTWIVYQYTVYPYIRFIYQNNTVTNDTITAETMWQDWL